MQDKNEFKYSKTPYIPELTVLSAEINTFRYKKHAHEDYALGVTTGGLQYFHCGGELVCSKRGSIMQINTNELHDGFAEDEAGFSYSMIYIPRQLFHDAASVYAPDSVGNFRFDKTILEDRLIRSRLMQLIRGINSGKAEKLIMEEFFLQLVEAVALRNTGSNWEAGRLKRDTIIDKALEYIGDNLNSRINLDDICKALSISKFHFVRLFRNYTGRTPYQYILDCKLRTVCKAIEKGKDIDLLIGDYCFCDAGHFNRRFKEVYGITPFQYRQSLVSKGGMGSGI